MLIEPLIETSRGDRSEVRWAIFILSSLSPGPLVVSLRIPLLMVLDIVHRPDGSLHVLHSLETLVEAQIVSHRVLKEKHISRQIQIYHNKYETCWIHDFSDCLGHNHQHSQNLQKILSVLSLIRCNRLSP